MNIEALAKILHEAGREAVERKAVVNPNTFSKFLEWDELEEHMKEGRRIQARFILKDFNLYPKADLRTMEEIQAKYEEMLNSQQLGNNCFGFQLTLKWMEWLLNKRD